MTYFLFYPPGVSQLQFLPLNSTPGVETTFVGHFDDGASHSILVPGPGLPFGNSRQRHLFVRELITFCQSQLLVHTMYKLTQVETCMCGVERERERDRAREKQEH